jgi:RNA recognition motif-containing protein
MNIHVSGLSEQISEDDLRTLFSVYGIVSFIVMVRDQNNGRSRGQAFVEMPNQSQGEQAVMALNKMVMDNRAIAVKAIEYKAGEFNN